MDTITFRSKELNYLAPSGWSESLSVGHPVLDGQHKRLLRICQHLGNTIDDDSPDGVEQFHIVLNDLAEYANEHFSTEERILREHSYPDLAAQVEEHFEYRSRLAQFLMEATKGYLNRQELQLFLGAWWKEHIIASDKLYSPYLQK